MKDDIENALGVFELDLLKWGVPPDESRKTARAWLAASLVRGKKEWTSRIDDVPDCEPESIVRLALQGLVEVSDNILEEACFASYHGNIGKLANAIENIPAMMNRFNADPPEFWRRLAKYSNQKPSGRAWIENQPAWLFFALEFWLNSKKFPPPLAGSPPVCLWTFSAIKTILKDSGAPKLENSIGQKLERDCNLHLPHGFAFQFIAGKWEKCDRKHKKG